MEVVKEMVRVITMAIGAIALIVFIVAPVKGEGLLWILGSAFVAILCRVAYKWSDKD